MSTGKKQIPSLSWRLLCDTQTEKQIQDYLRETAAAGEQCVCERIFSTGSED